MPTWQEQRQRFKGYLGPRNMIYTSLGFLCKTRPTWLGGAKRPRDIAARDYATGQLFQKMGSGFKDYEESSTSVPSLVASAYGAVLEVGPGMGSQLDRFDKSKVDHIYGVEPNPAFVSPLLAEVEKTGMQGKYTLILGLVEDEHLLAENGLGESSIDSIVCLQTLCSIRDPNQTMRWMFSLLKPGGVFLFWEHRRSHDFLTRLVQELWNPLWRFAMGGCNLNRSIGDIVRNAGDWDLDASELKEQNDPESMWSLLPRVEGRMVKRL